MRVWIVTTKEGGVSVFKNQKLVELSMQAKYHKTRMPTRLDKFGGQVTWDDGTQAKLVDVKEDVDVL